MNFTHSMECDNRCKSQFSLYNLVSSFRLGCRKVHSQGGVRTDVTPDSCYVLDGRLLLAHVTKFLPRPN
jgi:hypothetical protein